MKASCFEPILCSMKRRKMDKGSSITKSAIGNNDHLSITISDNTLTIHIIGATEEAEFWGGYKLEHPSCKDVCTAYAEALTDLVAMYNGIATIHLIFIGPDCPTKNLNEQRTIQVDHEIVQDGNGKQSGYKNRKHRIGRTCDIFIQSCRSIYTENLKNIPKPDICVFYNPGFTCPDYDWSHALDACLQRDTCKRVPFLVTTNTEMEAISDILFLYERKYIDDLPTVLRDIDAGEVDRETDPVVCDGNMVFFRENPHSGTRVRQSGNMANDLFVKNRWIYCGLFSGATKPNRKAMKTATARQKSTMSKHAADSRSNSALL
jgi:hypothetical protein